MIYFSRLNKKLTNKLIKEIRSIRILFLFIFSFFTLLIIPLPTHAISANIVFRPFYGADYYRVWMKGRNHYSGLFPHAYIGATLYAGTKLCDNLGLELGYDWSSRRSRRWRLTRGQPFFNTIVPRTFGGETRISRHGPHLDVVGFIPLPECFEFFASLGYGWVKPKIVFAAISISEPATPQSSAIVSLKGKAHGVLRLGTGISLIFADMVGIRFKLGWETTSSLSISGSSLFSQLGFVKRGFRDSFTAAIGGFVRF